MNNSPNTMKIRNRAIAFFAACFIPIVHGNTEISDYDPSSWGKVLDRYVDEKGDVDYIALYGNSSDLDRFIENIHAVGPVSTPELFPESSDQLAYYINAYNALVFAGVLSRGPEKKSVWRGLISGLNFFVRMDVALDGRVTNLRKLENDIIRDQFKDPRIHAALVCASKSCPRLIREPYFPDVLESQLDSAMLEFVSTETNVKVDQENNTVYLSEIFDWFDTDFLQYEKSRGNESPVLIDYINRYLSEENHIDRDMKIAYFKYDKTINAQ